MKSRLSYFSLSLALLAALPSVDVWAAEGSAEIPLRYYSTADGLTQSDVFDIQQDRTGHLWISTARGLTRYDGKEFQQFTIANGLPSNDLTVLHIDSENTVWVGDVRGSISAIRGNRVAEVIEPISDKPTQIFDIEVVGERVLAVADGVGIVEVVSKGQGYRLESIGTQSIDARDLVVSGSDIWVIAAARGMYRLTFTPEPELENVSTNITLAHVAADGSVWVVDRDNRVGVWKEGSFDVRAIIGASDELKSITSGPDGTVWVATFDDLFSFADSQPEVVKIGAAVREYPDVARVWTPVVDDEGTLWFAGISGLTRFLGDRFRHFRLRTGPDAVTVWSISADAHDRLWFGTETHALVREADETLTVIGPDHGIPSGPVLDLAHSPSGDAWLGVMGEGLFLVEQDTLRGELIAGTEGLYILDIGVTADETVWFSTMESGLFRYSPTTGVLRRFQSFGDRSIYSLDFSTDGSVWHTVDGVGLVQLIPKENGEYEQKTFEAGPGFQDSWFGQILLTGEQEAWVTGAEGGLYRFESGSFTNYGVGSPWADQTVYLVEALENGTLVAGGEQGLYQFVPGSPHVAHYGQSDGFIGVETNVHATFVDSNGFLWIGTVDGATRMDTSLPMPDYLVPTPHILSIESELDRLPIAQDANMEPDQRGIEVEFAAVSLSKPKGIEYSYKLAGIKDEWGAATSNQSVNYSGMPPGAYEFMVRARYRGGDWSSQYATHRFTVLPFVWQQPWFRLSLVIFALLTVWATMTYRTRRIRQLNAALRAEVADRTESIEQARHNLQISNEKLSGEIHERKKADTARMEIETRYRRAFEKVPVGMGLLDAKGRIFDANPALKEMFDLNSDAGPRTLFLDVIDGVDREKFAAHYGELRAFEIDGVDEIFSCVGADDEILQTAVSLSAVQSETGCFLYSVLQVQDITESRKLTDQLEYQASYDDLTGLLNRRSFVSELARAWEHAKNGNMLSHLIYMDLDQFKIVNDTSGHVAGDQLLRRVSEIVLDAVRGNDIACRLGGDEFGIILWECPTDVAYGIAESIRSEIENLRFRWDTQTYRIGVSIGGLPIDPDCGDVAELQQLADSACYAAKEAGRNRVHMVAGSNDSARIHRGQIRWVQRLRGAMDSNSFEFYTQSIKPLVDDVNEPERLEVMLQLRDPLTNKLISPSVFLPAAERYGLSIELDQWVVKNLLRTLAVQKPRQSEHCQYWVNLSGTSIGDERFAGFLMDAVKNSPLPPGTINFEIAETAVIRRIAEAGNLMSALREMGCRFALDDFGSALSSFDYLKKLPVDYLKIDGSFTSDLLRDKTDQIFVRSIIDIAHALDIKTVIALVENEALLNVVRRLGADYAQGTAIQKPVALTSQSAGLADDDQVLADVSSQVG